MKALLVVSLMFSTINERILTVEEQGTQQVFPYPTIDSRGSLVVPESLGYLPIAESDFVFAGLAEDLGFIGAAILFLLYIALLVAALRIAFRARDPFGMLLGGGIVAMLLFQILVNVGMAISLMPVTGIPLPFISHGGSSLVSILFALGVLQSIAMRREAPALG